MQTEDPWQDEIVGYRLSPQQTHAWLRGPREAAARAQCAVVLPVGIDEDRLRAALGALAERHEILRTTFRSRAGVRIPTQAIHEQLAPAVEVVVHEDESILRDPAALDELLAGEAARPVELEGGPLVRALLVRMPGDRAVLLLTISSLCADGPSLLVLVRELQQVIDDRAASLSAPLQYADFAEWRNELAAGDDAVEAKAFWQELVSAATPSPTLLFGRREVGGAASLRGVPVRAPEVSALAAIEQDVGAVTFLEACWHALVARLSGDSQVTILTVLRGRAQQELRDAVGAFEQALPIGSRVEEETTLAEVVDQVRRGRAELERKEDFVQAPDLGAFAESVTVGFAANDAADLECPVAVVRALPTAMRLAASWCRSAEGWRGEVLYDPAAYSREDAEAIARSYGTLLAAAVAADNAAVAELALVGDGERAAILSQVNDTAGDLPRTSVHWLFEEQAARTPERLAVRSGETALGFGELNRRANQVAHELRASGVGRNVAVGLCMDRSAEMIVGLLGILKAGGAYVPLNFEHPAARLRHQLEEADAAIVLTREALLDRLPPDGATPLCVDRDRARFDARSDEDPERINEPDDLVYVMYTSGSTGLPKGVGVTHANLLNYTNHMVGTLGADDAEGLQFAAVSAISTDLGNTAVFPSLASGGCLHLVSPQASMDGSLYASYASEHPIDVLKITPSHLAGLLAGREPVEILPRRWLVLGGEAASWDLVARLDGECRILNHYGPTETTVGSCTFDVGTDVARWDPATVPIGRPIMNTRVYVLDSRLEPVPAGVAGELCIGGAGVSLGYVGRPRETAEVFVPEVGAEDAGARMYRTGDRARFLPDGNLEFLGRVDQQVKIRGFRVEPAEVEAALLRHPAIRQAVVVADAGQGEPRLVAYLVASESPPAEELRAILAEVLPDFMIPSVFVPIDELPFTPSGKVDRRALPDPQAVEHGRVSDYVEPRTPLEAELAAIWADVLRLERVGATDDFFMLGGHSLLATQVIARVRLKYDVELPLHTLFISPTVASLAQAVTELLEEEDAELGDLLEGLKGLSEEQVGHLLAGSGDGEV